MKNLKAKVLTLISSVLALLAVLFAGSACYFIVYEPEIPEDLK